MKVAVVVVDEEEDLVLKTNGQVEDELLMIPSNITAKLSKFTLHLHYDGDAQYSS